MTTTAALKSLAILAVLALALTACSSNAGSDQGVASLAGDEAGAATPAGEDASTEEELLDYVACLREQGVDVADPQTDSEGNLVLGGPGGGGGGPGGGGGGPDQGGPPEGGGEGGGANRELRQTAMEACGDPPSGAFGGFERPDPSEMQDTAVEFAQCMRAEGIDMADPDFSAMGEGGEPSEGGGAAGGPGGGPGGGILGDLDRQDPEVEQALEQCQSILADRFGQGGPARRGDGE